MPYLMLCQFALSVGASLSTSVITASPFQIMEIAVALTKLEISGRVVNAIYR